MKKTLFYITLITKIFLIQDIFGADDHIFDYIRNGKDIYGGDDQIFDYKKDGKDWVKGQCKTGRSQSPIILYDVATKNYDPISKDKLVTWNYEKIPVTIHRGQYSFILTPKTTLKVGISGGGLETFYKLDHIHFHWESEHIITKSKKRNVMEAHFVHYKSKYTGVAQALSDPNGLAVIGAMYKIGGKNSGFKNIISMMKSGNNKTIMETFNLLSMLPKDLNSYYRYSGSLTTPPCSEVVVWTVLADRISISSEQVNWIKAEDYLTGTVDKSYRFIQELNNREVYGVGLNYMDYDEDSAQVRTQTSISLTIFCILLRSFD